MFSLAAASGEQNNILCFKVSNTYRTSLAKHWKIWNVNYICSPDVAANENLVQSGSTLKFLFFFNDLFTANFCVTFDDVLIQMLFILMS